eukprot:Lankesteria_metandrocarpae@DN4577_c0_g1_i1.p1
MNHTGYSNYSTGIKNTHFNPYSHNRSAAAADDTTGTYNTVTPTTKDSHASAATANHYYNPYNPNFSSSTSGVTCPGTDYSSASAVNYRMAAAKGRYEQDQRAALFGTLGGRAAGVAGPRGSGTAASMATAAALEADNDERVMDLAARVGDLRDISLKMREEVVESNKNLTGMSSQFDTVGGIMGTTMRRLTSLGQSGVRSYTHSSCICMLIWEGFL